MIRKTLMTGAAVAAFSLMVSASVADATTISFDSYPNGVPVTTVGIATFSLEQGAYGIPAYAAGPPVTGPFGVYGQLGNSQTEGYPTADILNVAFSKPISNVSFFFENFGANYSSSVTAYVGVTPVASTFLGGYGCSSGCFSSVGGSGITDLVFTNGEGTSRSWLYGVDDISFTSGVPEPSSWALMLSGFGFMGYVLRRRILGATRAA